MILQSFDPNHGRRGKLFGGWLIVVVALCFIWLGWRWPAIQLGTFEAGLARGRIERVAPSPGRRLDRLDATVGYRDGAGAPQDALDRLQAGNLRVGTNVWVVYIEGSPERAYVDPAMPTMIAIAMAPGLLGLPIGAWLLVHTRRRHAERRRALREWTRVDVHEPRIQLKSMDFGSRFGGALRTWRLQARIFDPPSGWRDIHSDWAGTADVPELGAGGDLQILIDPRHPRHYWFPLPVA